jgi:hypothetical protein
MQERDELRALKREIKMSRERKVKKKYVYGKEKKRRKKEERKKEECQERYGEDESIER